MVEAHEDVGAQPELEVDDVLGPEEDLRAVEVGGEADAFVGDADEGRQAVDLEAAAVGQDGPGPGDELVEPAQGLDGLDPRAQEEMIGVDQDDLRAEALDLVVGQPLDRALAGDGHEGGGLDRAVGGFEKAGPGRRAGILRGRRERRRSWGEPEVDDVAVLDDIVLALEPDGARFLGLRGACRAGEARRQGTTSARMKPLAMSEWMAPAASMAEASFLHRPGPDLVLADGKERDAVEEGGGLSGEERPALISASPYSAMKTARSAASSSARSPSIRPQKARTRRAPARAGKRALGTPDRGEVLLVEVEEVEEGLEAEEGEAADELLLGRRHRQAAEAAARFESRAEPGEQVPLLLALRVLHLLEVLLEPLQPRVDEDEVGQDELLLHAPDVRDRIHPAAGMREVLGRRSARTTWTRPSALRRWPRQRLVLTSPKEMPTRSVRSIDAAILLLLGVGGGDPVQARVGQGHGADVRLPLAVIVGPDGGVGAGEEIEKRRLARLGVAEQGDVHGD